MNQVSHFISDLHLCSQRPHLLALFEHYMREIAPQSQQLFVLGDLFEVWLGDDCLDADLADQKIYQSVVQLFQNYAGDLFIMHGNRDFLLGEDFMKAAKAQLIAEPYIFSIMQQKTALLHGDILCTDDTDYQAFRKMVRNPDWQQDFLALPLDKRLQIASSLRQQSQQQQKQKSMAIMDVNQNAVVEFMQGQQIQLLIHGHTHRQATHRLTTQQGEAKRVVLSDWNEQGFYLSLDNEGIKENYFALS